MHGKRHVQFARHALTSASVTCRAAVQAGSREAVASTAKIRRGRADVAVSAGGSAWPSAGSAAAAAVTAVVAIVSQPSQHATGPAPRAVRRGASSGIRTKFGFSVMAVSGARPTKPSGKATDRGTRHTTASNRRCRLRITSSSVSRTATVRQCRLDNPLYGKSQRSRRSTATAPPLMLFHRARTITAATFEQRIPCRPGAAGTGCRHAEAAASFRSSVTNSPPKDRASHR